jgi:hypothetical protein
MIRRFVISSEGSALLEGHGLSGLRRTFPSVDLIVTQAAPPTGEVRVFDAEEWRDPAAALHVFDERVGQTHGGDIFLVAPKGSAALVDLAFEILTRYQAFVWRRNEASDGPLFDRVLAGHRALHDVRKPLVHADLLHALDTHAWLLRLAPDASLALQIAALFHDVERLASEADVRIEHHAEDYEAFKREHARGSARMMADVLGAAGVAEATAARAGALVERHESPDGDDEVARLNDADSLSFFSRNSDGFLRYYGPEHTRKKVAYTLRRMRPAARAELERGVRLHPEVRRLVVDWSRRASATRRARAEE